MQSSVKNLILTVFVLSAGLACETSFAGGCNRSKEAKRRKNATDAQSKRDKKQCKGDAKCGDNAKKNQKNGLKLRQKASLSKEAGDVSRKSFSGLGGKQSSSKPVTPGDLKNFLGNKYDNSKYFSPKLKVCNFNGGTPLKNDYNSSVSSCNHTFKQANQLCDANSNEKLKRAVANVRKAIKEIQSSPHQSVEKSCAEYSKSASELNQALDSFAGKCDSIQSQCQEICQGTTIKSDGAATAISYDPDCMGNFDSMLKTIDRNFDEATEKSKQCSQHQKTVQQANHDARELTESQIASRLCNKQVARECDENSIDPSCLAKKEDNHSLSESNPEQQEILEPQHYDNYAPSSGSQASGSRSLANSLNRPHIPKSLNDSSLQTSSKGNLQTNAAKGTQATGAAANEKVSEYKATPIEELEKATAQEAIARGDQTLNPEATQKRQHLRSEELNKYMPGGSHDPDYKFPDGITKENGRNLFEKISNRYADHRANLNSFSSQVKNMDKESLKHRTQRKMTLQENRLLQRQQKKSK